jgi:hypothetical protein
LKAGEVYLDSVAEVLVHSHLAPLLLEMERERERKRKGGYSFYGYAPNDSLPPTRSHPYQ